MYFFVFWLGCTLNHSPTESCIPRMLFLYRCLSLLIPPFLFIIPFSICLSFSTFPLFILFYILSYIFSRLSNMKFRATKVWPAHRSVISNYITILLSYRTIRHSGSPTGKDYHSLPIYRKIANDPTIPGHATTYILIYKCPISSESWQTQRCRCHAAQFGIH